MNESQLDNDVLRGLSNGYPECCIGFYVTDWRYAWYFILHGPDEERSFCEEFVDAHNTRQGNGVGYVMCPRCLDERRSAK